MTNENNNLTETKDERYQVLTSISQSFYQNEMSYMFYRLIDKCIDEYEFEPKTVYILFSLCYDQCIHRNYSQVERIAKLWHERAYKKPEDVDAYFLQSKKVKRIIKLCGELFRKRLNGMDVERIEQWVNDYDATEPLVKYAFRQNEFRSNLTMKHIGDTLAKWHENGIKTLEDAAKFCEKEHQENIQKRNAVMRAKEEPIHVFSVQPLWHIYSDESPVKNGPYLVTQQQTVNDGVSITVEKRWFRDGEWPLTQYEKSIGVKLKVLSWAILPSPYIPQTDSAE